jgi:hypothetical protein
VETAVALDLEYRPGARALAREPYRIGDSGRLMRTARWLTLSGGAAALTARGSRGAAAASAVLLGAGALCTRFAVLRAGVTSARDPKYVVAAQRGQAASGPRPAG